MSRFMLINLSRFRLAPCRGLRSSATRAESVQQPTLWKPFGFAVAVSGASVGGAALWQYEAARAAALQPSWPRSLRRQPRWPALANWWAGLTPGQRLFAPVCAANVGVFLAWRVPRFQPTMMRFFCSNPQAVNRCWPMLLSTFSHHSGLHLLANMYVLHSFSSGACHALGSEQLAALYISAGVWSSFASYVCKTLTHTPGLSLGASGAIMAVLALVCCEFPDTQLSIIFLPMFTFSAAAGEAVHGFEVSLPQALKGILLLDSAGVALGWKMFDHAAHLGGAAFGIGWSVWGRDLWRKREPAMRRWHQLRGSPIK